MVDAIITIRATDAALRARGSTTSRKCSRCGANVLLAPTGEKTLKENPEAMIICFPCFVEIQGPDDTFQPPTKEQLTELGMMEPNLYRERN